MKALVVIKSGKRMETDDERMMETKDNVSSSQVSVYGAYLWVLVPKCVHVHPPDLHR